MFASLLLAASLAIPSPFLSGFHPDPSICRGGDGAYYLATSSFLWSPGVPVYRSTDLKTWTLQSHVIPDLRVLGDDRKLRGDDGIWAPTIRYHDGLYYIVVTYHDAKQKNYLATAKDPKGPWSAPRLIEGATGGIDPSLFFEEGKCYFLANRGAKPQPWKHATELYISEIDLTNARLVGEKVKLSNGVLPGAEWAEGPHLYKIGGKYVLLNAEGGTDFGHAECAMSADSLFGPYTPLKTNPLITRRDRGTQSPLQATGHADLVEIGTNRFLAVFLGKRVVDGRVLLGRETFACFATWKDGDLVWEAENDQLVAGKIKHDYDGYSIPFDAARRVRNYRRITDVTFAESISVPPGSSLFLGRSPEHAVLKTNSDATNVVMTVTEKDIPAEWDCEKEECDRFTGLGLGILPPEGPSVIPVYGGKKAMVAITYDDGLISHYNVARPMHAKYKVGGTFFVPVSCADDPKKRNRHGDRCDWDMLQEMEKDGLEIASHTMTHANLRKLRDAGQYEQVTNEIVGAKAVFASHGIDVKTIAFGFNARYDGAVALCRATGQYPRLYQFGTGSKDTCERYDNELRTRWSKENEYSILMIHGVTKDTGGYNPIPDLATYEHLIRILAESPDVYAGDMKTCSAYRERAEHTRLEKNADGTYTVTFDAEGTICGPGPIWVRLSDGTVIETKTGATITDK